ncbi:MAG: hypothetical protein AAF204_03330 [Pseudomonadota bacterium]
MKIKHLLFGILMAFMALNATPALAQSTSQAEAQRLQTLFQTMLEARQAEMEKNENDRRTLTLEGSVEVEPTESFYAITLPQMKITYPDARRIDIGMTAINASPSEEAGQFKMTMALPSPILGFDGNDQEIMRLNIGSQKTAGVWNEELENFTKLDALFSDITMSLDQGTVNVTLPEVRTIYDLEETESQRWSGPVSFELKGLNAVNSKDSSEINLQSLNITTILDQFAAQAFKAESATPETEKLSPLKMANGAEMQMRLNGLEIKGQDKSGAAQDLKFDSLGASFNYSGAMTNTAKAGFSLGFQGLSSSDTPADIKGILPKSGRLSLKHENIPISELAKIMQNTESQDAKVLGLSLLFKVPAILAQAGSYIEIQESFLSNDDYRADLQSTLRADITAANSATAKGTLRFAGLDKVLSMAQVAGTRLNSSNYAERMRTLARFLERLKPMGRIETAPDGSGFVHVFDLEMNAEGQFLINGQDAKPLLSNQQPKQPALPPAAP